MPILATEFEASCTITLENQFCNVSKFRIAAKLPRRRKYSLSARSALLVCVGQLCLSLVTWYLTVLSTGYNQGNNADIYMRDTQAEIKTSGYYRTSIYNLDRFCYKTSSFLKAIILLTESKLPLCF